MPPSKPGASLDALRHAAAEAEQASSLRAVAREIGMSPTGLRNFLDGQTPYPSTRRKLNLWYARYRLSRRVYEEDEVSAGLALLLEAIPEAGYARAAERVLACVAEVHADTHVEAPAWLARLREAVARREGGGGDGAGPAG
ncbi:MAG TPA: hypothetical protein VHG91_08895 [Longimicrobium sp.]|nr:hypothetical protein [Longimicrobium sp.]